MRWYDRITAIDRRIIYLFLTLFVIVPFFIPFTIGENIMPQTRRLFDFIESIPPDEKVVMISFDYTPQTAPECHPMALALLRHCFGRKLKVIGVSFDPQGPGLAVEAFDNVAEIMNEKAVNHQDSVIYGEDYIYLGWKSGRVAALLEMGESIISVYPRDHFRNAVDSFPIMSRVNNYKEIAISIILAAAAYPEEWVMYPQARYGLNIGAGLTAVMAPQYYPFVQTGQFSGMMSGMKGAAEYEKLIVDHGYTEELGSAERGMNSQSLIHIMIIILIILGNVGFFFSRRARK